MKKNQVSWHARLWFQCHKVMDLATLSGYVLSMATFRVLARDCLSPSLLSGPPCFSSALMSFLSAVFLAPCLLPSGGTQLQAVGSPRVWPQVGLLVSSLTHTPSTAGAPAAGQASGWQPAQVPACPQESIGSWGRLTLSMFAQPCTHSLL